MNQGLALGLTAIALMAALSSPTVAQDAPNPSPFKKVASSALPFIAMEGELENFKTALQRQIDRCNQENLDETFLFGTRRVSRKTWCVDTNKKFLELAQQAHDFPELMRKARDQFEWYQSEGNDGKGTVLFTSYDSPTLHASLAPTTEYSFPLYSKPDDLVKVMVDGQSVWRRRNPDGSLGMHFTRKEVDMDGALKGKGLEIAYATDLLSIADLQTEGSGILILHYPDGTQERRFLNYSASNGHPWVAMTKIMRAEGVPEEFLTHAGMRKYFAAHPEKLMPTLIQNPSYVYFQFAQDGPYGCDSILLSPHHSVAMDLRVFPQGVVTMFHTDRPEVANGEIVGSKEFSTLAVNQDTGGAIVGPGHIDIYWGGDEYAVLASGKMNSFGTLFLALLPENAH